MKITEKQLQLLMTTLHDTIKKNIVGVYSIPIEGQAQLYNDILNQQSDELIDVDKGNNT
jgi:hypothetical protein